MYVSTALPLSWLVALTSMHAALQPFYFVAIIGISVVGHDADA